MHDGRDCDITCIRYGKIIVENHKNSNNFVVNSFHGNNDYIGARACSFFSIIRYWNVVFCTI